jgi:SPP1 family predicted phage head-tail adaptor
MKAGKLDREIIIEHPVQSTDELGGIETTWMPKAQVWASKEDVSDGERVRAAEVGASVTTRFRIHWGADVKVTDRVICEGRTYDIFGVKEINRHEGQEITAAARAE